VPIYATLDPALADEVVTQHNIEPQGLEPGHCCVFCGTAEAVPFPVVPSPNSGLSMRQYVDTHRGARFPAVLSPNSDLSIRQYVWTRAEAHFPLHFPQNLSRNEKLATYFWREGHDFQSCCKDERNFPALAAEVVSRHNIERRGLKPRHCCACCGTAKAVPFPVVPSPNVDSTAFAARLKPCPSRSCYPQNF